ncbi:MAG: methionine ABC transporter substrate-binding protein [Campylobacteraceae bacterium]|jgi:D-methionine transport system substrate-binding protein|nr:methionine ABC transporter substrate-binding protein [Campylobacteraceae bacterium]
MKTKSVVKFTALLFASLALTTALVGCSKKEDSKAPTLLKVGVCAGPYGDMFVQAIAPSLKEKGYAVEIVEFSDYVQPNKALSDGEINLNMFQHSTYLKNFSAEYKLDLKHIVRIPTAGMGIFSEKFKSIDELPEGATIAIPNDVTNLARTMRVLEQTGLVKIDEKTNPAQATQYTLSSNPKNLKFVEIEAPQLPRSLESVDAAVINGNFAISAGLKLSSALFNEQLQEGYINGIAVRTSDQDAQFVKDILSVVHSDAFRKVINDPNNQYSSFYKPKDF